MAGGVQKLPRGLTWSSLCGTVTVAGFGLAYGGYRFLRSRSLAPTVVPSVQRAQPSLEVCVESVQGAVAAEEGGASRIELCDNLLEGGTTPSIGKVKVCMRRCTLPIHVMVRPRGGDFLYSTDEWAVMVADMICLKEQGVHGFVLGVLLADGRVDEVRLKAAVALAAPLPVTFHRAIDVTPDPVEAMSACIRCGVSRILSSGGAESATLGTRVLERLASQALGRITVAAGAGVTEESVGALIRSTGVHEVHASAREPFPSAMSYRPDKPIYMGGERLNGPTVEFERRETSGRKVSAIVASMRQAAERA